MPESDHAAKAAALLAQLRIDGPGDGPAFGAIKAEAATAFAMLAVAQAIENLAREVGSIGGELYPIHTREV
jgi:hypothetical protein